MTKKRKTLELKTICFLPGEAERSENRDREIREAAKGLRMDGLEVTITEERPEKPDPETLYLTDSAETYRKLSAEGFSAAGYLHAGNRGESFEGADYLLEQPEEVDADSYVKIWQRLSGLPWTIALTERLWIREMVPEDLEELYRLYEDEEARRFLEPLSEDRERELAILKAYIQKVYGFCGYGMWAVCDRRSGELIGKIGFEPYQGAGEAVDFGYIIRRDVRGRGLAAEAAEAVLGFASESLGLEKICIHTSADNVASIALAEKLGFAAEVDADQKTGIRYFTKDLRQRRSI